MQNFPTLQNFDFKDKKVLVRGDLDVPMETGKILEEARIEMLLPTLKHLLESGAKQVLLIGHKGRPEGLDEKESLLPLVEYFKEHLTPETKFINHQAFSLYFEVQEEILKSTEKFLILENLRFWPEEESNNQTLAEQLAYGQDVFVNEAFASSHRAHASIVGLPKYLPSLAGLHFFKEIENLSKVRENPRKPVVALISGLKKDKLEYIDAFKEFCDKILVGGRLPEFYPDRDADPKLLIAHLNPDKEDITIHSIEKFEETVATAGTVIVSGPISHWEDPGHKLGTERVFTAVAKSKAFKVAGGGDTTAAIKHFHLENLFDWVSSGGGASLDYLAHQTLPGIESLVNSKKI